MRNCWKLPLCPIDPMTTGSEKDLLLAKAKPISDSNASVISYLRQGKKLQQVGGVKICERNNSVDMQVSKEGGGGGAPGAGREIPLQPVEKTW